MFSEYHHDHLEILVSCLPVCVCVYVCVCVCACACVCVCAHLHVLGHGFLEGILLGTCIHTYWPVRLNVCHTLHPTLSCCVCIPTCVHTHTRAYVHPGSVVLSVSSILRNGLRFDKETHCFHDTLAWWCVSIHCRSFDVHYPNDRTQYVYGCVLVL